MHCGNSPKMERTVELVIALADRDAQAAKALVREDFVWSEPGGAEVLRYERLETGLADRPAVDLLQVSNALSHGKAAMCEGQMTFADGDRLAFCAVVAFANTAKDARIVSAHFYYEPIAAPAAA